MGKVLMIGLGGTGIKTLVQIKQQLKGRSPDGKMPDNVELLGLDTLSKPETIDGVFDPNAKYNQRIEIGLDETEFVNRSGYLGYFLKDHKDGHLDWMCADWYLNHPNSSIILTPEDGAGMYRQIGRLTLMAMLESGKNSTLFSKLSSKIEKLRGTESQFYVLVFASLAGGTGASMVGDIPYIIKYIAKSKNMVPKTVGFFALPEAFKDTGQVRVTDDMRARSIAAIRELDRFTIITDSSLGYQMVYDKDGKISFRTDGGAYSMMYFFDERKENPLKVDVAYGVCATMASFAWMFADPNPNQKLTGHLANRDSKISKISEKYNGFNPPLCASIGTYSYVLPLGAMVESWTYRFAKEEVLDRILPRDQVTGTILTNRFGNEDVTAGGRNVKQILKEELGRINKIFIDDVIEIGGSEAAQKMNEERATHLHRLEVRSISEWIGVVKPPDPTENQVLVFEDMDPDNSYLCKISRGLMGREVVQLDEKSMVSLESPKNYGNSDKEAARMLIENCEDSCRKKYNLWKGVLRERVNVIFERQTKWLREKTSQVLNGSEIAPTIENAVERKEGRLGWWWDFLKELVRDYGGLINILEAKGESFEAEIEILEGSLHGADGISNDIEYTLNNKASDKNQKMYLAVQQQIFELNRKLLLLVAELEIAYKLKDYTASLLKNVEEFINAICLDQDINFEAALEKNRQMIDNERKDAGKFKFVREYVYDEDWENAQYRIALQPDSQDIYPVSRVLDHVQWVVSQRTDDSDYENPKDVPQLKLLINGFPLDNRGYLRENHIEYFDSELPKHKKDELVTASIERIVARCRKVFLPIWQKISVMDYLVYKWDGAQPHSPSDFADHVKTKIGVVLDDKNQTEATKSVFYLAPETTNPKHHEWSRDVYTDLKEKIEGAENDFADLDHTDPTTFTVMSSIDYVDYRKLSVFDAKQAYLDMPSVILPAPRLSRPCIHVFKPEKEACRYDDKNSDTILGPMITGLFENKDKLELFLQGLIWGFIKIQSQYDNQGVLYVLELEPRENEEDKDQRPVTKPYQEYLVNDVNNEYIGGLIPPLLVAAQTFCLRKEAFNKQRIASTLQTMADFEDRLREEIGLKIQKVADETLRSWESGDVKELTANQRIILEMPESKARRDKLTQLVLKEKYRAWSRAIDSGESELSKIFSEFDKARIAYDEHKRLQIFSESEKEFIEVCLDNMVYSWFQNIQLR